MILIAGNQIGRVHHAAGHPALAKTRPVYCFVPETFFDGDGFQKGRYLISRWPSINCGVNPHGIGSHVIPDPFRPADLRSRCPVLREFLRQLEHVAATKATPTAA